MFATRIVQFVLGLVAVFVVAWLIGVNGSGQFSLVQTWIGMLFAIGQLGMPAAMTFFAGRGRSLASLERISIGLTLGISAAIALVAIAALPWLRDTALKALAGESAVPDALLVLSLVGVPFQFFSQFAAGALYARGHNLAFNRISVAQSAVLVVFIVILVGVVPFGASGAIVAYLAANGLGALAAMIELHRLARRPEGRVGEALPLSEFASYGLKLYPQNVTSFFSYRADVFLLSWLRGDAALLGQYNIAVRIAEMTFYVPDSISAMLYPAISASKRGEANRFAPAVSRLAMLATLIVALAIVPAGFVAIWFLLRPEFRGALPALLVIMPGIVSLSLSKMLAAYISGLGRPLPTAVAATTGLVTNLVANLLLIPRFGIVGAAAASLISYSVHAAILLVFATRFAAASPLAFVVPRRAEFERIRATALAVGRRLRAMRARASEPAAAPAPSPRPSARPAPAARPTAARPAPAAPPAGEEQRGASPSLPESGVDDDAYG